MLMQPIFCKHPITCCNRFKNYKNSTSLLMEGRRIKCSILLGAYILSLSKVEECILKRKCRQIMQNKIAAIVVTYNRLTLLKQCVMVSIVLRKF